MQEKDDDNFREVLVYGKAAVHAVFERRRTAITKLVVSGDNTAEFAELCSWLASEHKPYEIVERAKIARIAGSDEHEGVVATTRRPVPPAIKPAMRDEWHDAGEKIVFVDEGIAPRRLATIARVAAINGVSRFVVPEKSVADVMSSTAWSLSSGAFEQLKIYSTESMTGILRMMGERFFIVGMVREGGRRIDYGSHISFPGKTVALYVSNDPNGVPAATIARCGYLLHISEPAGAKIFYAPDELAAHVLPWLYAKQKKGGEGFFARKKAAKAQKNSGKISGGNS